MRRFLLVLLVMFAAIPAAKSQFTKIGGGTGFTTGYHFHEMDWDYNKSGHVFASLKGIYEITVPIHISPSITFFIPHVYKEFEYKYTVNTLMFDINGHYIFNSLDKFEFYGLAGLDILLAWKREKYASELFKESDNALGLNLGAGSYMKLTEQFDLYVEAKYILSKYNQFMLNVGALINIDWLKKHEDTGSL
jgi:opacity protein-like surface antigen